MPEFRLVDVTEQPYVYADCKCAMAPADISRTMGNAFALVMEFIQKNGLTLTGPALSVYYSYDPETVEFRAGFFVSAEDAKKASGAIKAGMTPAGRVVSFTHVGPYSKFSESYGALMEWMQGEGLALGAPTWETYVDDPDSTPEAELRTDIYVSLA
ncbi:MAG: GyrI-like domain-containing protein [Oricola sp.]